jgi:hypothetical protein
MIGPRSRAVAAPQLMGNRFAPGAGCDVSRMWSVRLDRVIARYPQNGDGPPNDGPKRRN